jgi:hypothetical protein
VRYYQVNPRKTRFLEFTRVCHPHRAKAALMWLPMKFGLVQLSVPPIPRPESIGDLLVEEQDLPSPARSIISDSIASARLLGFEDPIFNLYLTRSRGQSLTGVCARCRHRDRRFIFQSLCSFNQSALSAEQQIVSFFADGSTLATSNGRPKYNRQPTSEAYYYLGKPLTALLEAHRAALANHQDSPVPVGSRTELIRRVDAMTVRFFDFMVGRGVFEEAVEPATADTADVIPEPERLQR